MHHVFVCLAMACHGFLAMFDVGISVSRPGIETLGTEVKVLNPNHWTTT